MENAGPMTGLNMSLKRLSIYGKCSHIYIYVCNRIYIYMDTCVLILYIIDM